MKNHITLLLTLFVCFKLSAQTKQVTIQDPLTKNIEKYFVLNADKNVREGKYQMYHWGGKRLLCEGYYKNNQKDSLWMNYGYQGDLMDSGYYKADKKIGVWSVYVFKGRPLLDLQYDYTNKKLLVFHPDDADTGALYNIITDTGKIQAILDRPPVFLDGKSLLKMQISSGIKLSHKDMMANVSGTVLIAFVIDAKGNVSNYTLKKALRRDGRDEAAMAAVKNIKGEWLPGIYKGNAVAVEYTIPVVFEYDKYHQYVQ